MFVLQRYRSLPALMFVTFRYKSFLCLLFAVPFTEADF